MEVRPGKQPEYLWIQRLDVAIVAMTVLLTLAGLLYFFGKAPSPRELAEKWGFKRPGAVPFAEELISRANTTAFPFVYEAAYRALEGTGELTTDESEGALLFLFWYTGQQVSSLEDRKSAGSLFLSRLVQHPDLRTCGFEAISSIENLWAKATVQALLPAFQTFFLQFHRALSGKGTPDLLERLDRLTADSGPWKAIRPVEVPLPPPEYQPDQPSDASGAEASVTALSSVSKELFQ